MDVVSEKDAYSSQERICCLRSYYNYFESYLEKLVIQPQYSTSIYIFYDFFFEQLEVTAHAYRHNQTDFGTSQALNGPTKGLGLSESS